jgi:sugar/nucleoside kinase (ribokinase family)
MNLCAGEARIDMLPREVAGIGYGFLPVAGEATFNTPIALGRLGISNGHINDLWLKVAVSRTVMRDPTPVCQTRGTENAVAFRPNVDPVDVPARRAGVVETVGAGDTVNAGILAGLQEAGDLSPKGVPSISEASLNAALNPGAEAAAPTVYQTGAHPTWKSGLT